MGRICISKKIIIIFIVGIIVTLTLVVTTTLLKTKNTTSSRASELANSGIPVQQDEFPSVAYIAHQEMNGSYRFICSGVLIDAYWVLTARHCFIDDFQHANDSQNRIRKNPKQHPEYYGVGINITSESDFIHHKIDVAKFVVDKEDYNWDFGSTGDYLLLKLASPAPATPALLATNNAQYSLGRILKNRSDTYFSPQVVDIVGFGKYTHGTDNDLVTLRKIAFPLISINSDKHIFTFGYQNPTADQLKHFTEVGDSGGAIFEYDYVTRSYILLGIVIQANTNGVWPFIYTFNGTSDGLKYLDYAERINQLIKEN